MRGKSKAILLVEDEDDLRNLATETLSGGGYFVHPVWNGDVAMVILRERVKFDLLFTDIVMPGLLNGLELAQEAKRIQPDIQVLYATGFALAMAQPLDAPPGAMLSKPYRPSELLARVEALLRDR